jgi:hypothetical protein
MLGTIINQLQHFRQSLYDLLPKRADSTMDLLDSLSANTNADSIVKLSLNPLFRRCYSSIFDVIENFMVTESNDLTGESKVIAEKEREKTQQALMQLVGEQCPPPTSERPFRLLGLDCTSSARPYASKLEDRHVVYSPNPTPSNRPIVIGHQYSILACLPDRQLPHTPAWILPCSTERVPSKEKGNEWGMKQLDQWLNHPDLKWGEQLSVVVGDSLYSTLTCQQWAKKQDQLLLISRLRSNRNVYAPPPKKSATTGHPKWYGAKMNLKIPETYLPIDDHQTFEMTTRKGKAITVTIDCWWNLRMKGSQHFRTDQYPFTLLRVQVTMANGYTLYKRPLWLVVFGSKRHELSPQTIYDCFRQRYDLEHYFRFGKQRLLMDSFQTPTVDYEENWWQLVQLAYVQLYLGRELATPIPHPWERYLPEQNESAMSSPSQTLRNFDKIVNRVGTPAIDPTKRGQSPGRKKGDCPPRRQNSPVIYKNSKSNKENVSKNKGKKETTGLGNMASSLKTKSYSDVINELQSMIKEIGMTMSDFVDILTLEFST